ncbi:MAG: hypothetical protein J1E78_05140 [Muribaculaceae bacterium]|nr:hypothetical protein [Muribaculaceae bacterium]
MEKINEIRQIWQEMDRRLSKLEIENKKIMQTVMKSTYSSAKEKLLNKYLRFIIIECVMITFMNLFFIFNPLIVDKYRILAITYWDIFFLLEVSLDIYLFYQTKDINIYTSTITEITKKASMNWKIHKIGVLAGLPLSFVGIFIMALSLNAYEYILYGMAVGGVLGLIIGVIQFLKFRSNYKLLVKAI